jgi:hypothetical protein
VICETHLPGLYVVGDASRDVAVCDPVAAAEGAKAAVAINKALQARAGLAVAPQDPIVKRVHDLIRRAREPGAGNHGADRRQASAVWRL